MEYTVTCEYSATGEGLTSFLLYTLAPRKEKAKERFSQIFGGYMASGCDVKEGFDFHSDIPKLLCTPVVMKSLTEYDANVEYHASFHFNFS